MSHTFPQDWYWLVGGAADPVFSASARDYVPASTPDYQAFLGEGNAPTEIATEAELGEVLEPYGVRPVPQGILDGYKNAKVTTIMEAVFKVLFNHENRLRAIERSLGLNGSPPDVTVAQAKAAIKGMM